MSSAARLKSGQCGLTDGSTAGQWRLPTLDELVSRHQHGTSGFTNVQGVYCSSKTTANGSASYLPPSRDYREHVWIINMDDGSTGYGLTSSFYYVWPVRGGQ